ncbi:MAG: hypothetical protein FJ197_06405 [Gammaproteobacteria bacterium]|nr:hypothetical protein [Gammaproteobacteria bacterium]
MLKSRHWMLVFVATTSAVLADEPPPAGVPDVAPAAEVAAETPPQVFITEVDADQVLQSFYGWVLAHPGAGLPAAAEREALEPLLSAQLNSLLDDAAVADAACRAAAQPGEKPEILEGDLFVGNFEGATEVAYGDAASSDGLVTVAANLVYVDERFPKGGRNRTRAWRDDVLLRLDGAAWTIADVSLGQRQSLVRLLGEYVTVAAQDCRQPP